MLYFNLVVDLDHDRQLQSGIIMAGIDIIKPTLTGLTLQSDVDVTEGSVAAQFSVGATDENSGVYQVYVLFDRQFNNLFFQDSLLYPDFFHKDFFQKRYELNTPYLRDMMQRMDSVKNSFYRDQAGKGKATH